MINSYCGKIHQMCYCKGGYWDTLVLIFFKTLYCHTEIVSTKKQKKVIFYNKMLPKMTGQDCNNSLFYPVWHCRNKFPAIFAARSPSNDQLCDN